MQEPCLVFSFVIRAVQPDARHLFRRLLPSKLPVIVSVVRTIVTVITTTAAESVGRENGIDSILILIVRCQEAANSPIP